MEASISEVLFGRLADGREAKRFILKNSHGAKATFTDLGASWIGFQLADDQPSLVLGCDTLDAFSQQQAMLGSTVGRFANRISNGTFTLDGKQHQLETNQPPHHIHGGSNNLSKRIWQSHIELVNSTPTLTFSYFSPNGEENYPGNVQFKIIITLNNDNKVDFIYSGVTDQKTIINLTNHAYFNLQGCNSNTLINHEFTIPTDTYLVPDEHTVPTGEVASVENTIMDFRKPKSVYYDLKALANRAIQPTQGFDHCYCYDQKLVEKNDDLMVLALAKNHSNNIELICSSTLPGMQFYTGNFLGGTPINSNERYESHAAFCFEPGYWPDSPNHEHFPDCIFDVQRPYNAKIQYWFKTTR